MTFQLRDYQQDFVAAIRASMAKHRRVLGVASTGAGKTACFSYITASAAAKGNGALILAHRAEICRQISAALDVQSVRHGMIAPGKTATVDSVQVGMVQTVANRLDRIAPPKLIIVDEAHHAITSAYAKVFAAFPGARILGVTATPGRPDGRGLDSAFDDLVEAIPMRALIERGALAPYRYLAPRQVADLSGVKTRGGDYALDELADAMDKATITGDAVEHYRRFLDGAPTVVFCTSIAHAEHVAEQFRAAGYRAASVDGKLPEAERTRRLSALADGSCQVLTSCDLISEGVDVPGIVGCILLRPTKSVVVYMQQCLDAETEILTRRGWVGSGDIEYRDEVAGWEQTSGAVEWCGIEEITARPLADGERMYGISSPHLDIRVTGGHDMLVMGRGKTCVNWQKVQASAVACRNAMFRIPVSGVQTAGGADLTDSELKFLGWFLTDGTLNKTTNAITISQSAGKPTHCEEIRAALRGCGFKFGECAVKRTGRFEHCSDSIMFYVSKGAPKKTGLHLRGWGALESWCDKSIPEIYESLDARQFGILLAAMNLGDGANNRKTITWTPGTMTIAFGDNEAMADRIQSLCVRRGYRANKAAFRMQGRPAWWYLHIKRRVVSTIAGNGVRDGSVSGKKPYVRSRFSVVPSVPGELVWCVRNRLGSLIIRRNGKVAIVGNCGRALRPKPGGGHAVILDHVGNVHRHGLPDAARVWTLEGRKRGAEREIQTATCETCFRVFEKYAGWKAEASCADPDAGAGCLLNEDRDTPGRKQIETVDGMLEEIADAPEWTGGISIKAAIGDEWKRLVSKARTPDQLAEIARLRGFKHGWVKNILDSRKGKSLPALFEKPEDGGEELRKIAEMYNGGMSMAKIGEALGMGQKGIHSRLKKAQEAGIDVQMRTAAEALALHYATAEAA